MFSATLLDATPVFLLSPWKPVLICIAFIGWGWIVSTHLEKDARAAHLNAMMWNGIHTTAALAALGVMLFAYNFYIAYPLGILVLVAPILVYWKVRNDAVTEEHQFYLGADTIKNALNTRKLAKANRQASLRFNATSGTVQVPQKDDPQLETYLTADEMISESLLNRASRLEFQLTSKIRKKLCLID